MPRKKLTGLRVHVSIRTWEKRMAYKASDYLVYGKARIQRIRTKAWCATMPKVQGQHHMGLPSRSWRERNRKVRKLVLQLQGAFRTRHGLPDDMWMARLYNKITRRGCGNILVAR